jgi:hypothetical protein
VQLRAVTEGFNRSWSKRNTGRSWAEFAALFRNTRSAFLNHERAKSELKALMPEDAKEAIGHPSARIGVVSFDVLDTEPVVAALTSALAKAQAEVINPGKVAHGKASAASAMRRSPAGSTSCVRRWAARDRHLTDNRHRSERRHGQFDHHARPRIRRVDRFGLAGLSDRRGRTPQRLTYARRYGLFHARGMERKAAVDELAEIGEPATINRLLQDLEVEDRLGARIDKYVKRLMILRGGLKSLPTAFRSAPPQATLEPQLISGPTKAA